MLDPNCILNFKDFSLVNGKNSLPSITPTEQKGENGERVLKYIFCQDYAHRLNVNYSNVRPIKCNMCPSHNQIQLNSFKNLDSQTGKVTLLIVLFLPVIDLP